jgi:hypothetical protein
VFLPRSFWILLIVGLALRCVAIDRPLIDAHLLRQCQTAAITRSMTEEAGFPLSARIPWLGDLDARFVLEPPVYNYLVLGLHRLTGNLDISGKVVSILLWAASFFCLQGIWRRLLNPQQTLWANVLFVIAPLSVFYAQAFMPEMLVQLLAFAFVLLTIRYDESPSLGRWTACAGAGLVGLLVKLPEISHLYFLLGFLVFRRQGWKAALSPRYLVAAVITIAALKAWSSYADSINIAHLPEWTSKEVLQGFIGTLESRIHFKPWIMIALYLGAFVVPGVAALAAMYGLWIFVRRQCKPLLGVWLVSLVCFYLIWFGNGGAAQSYYNLPALAPLCALVGIGLSEVLTGEKIARWQRTASIVAGLLIVIPVPPILLYLFKSDRQIFAAANWVRANTTPGDLILFRPNHRFDMVDYPYNPVLAYYGERPTFVWTRNTSDTYRQAALTRSRFAVVTLPPAPDAGFIARLNRFRGVSQLHVESLDWLEANGFKPVFDEKEFRAYMRP